MVYRTLLHLCHTWIDPIFRVIRPLLALVKPLYLVVWPISDTVHDIVIQV